VVQGFGVKIAKSSNEEARFRYQGCHYCATPLTREPDSENMKIFQGCNKGGMLYGAMKKIDDSMRRRQAFYSSKKLSNSNKNAALSVCNHAILNYSGDRL